MGQPFRRVIASIACGWIGCALILMAQSGGAIPFGPADSAALTWRNIGPFRGGRVTAVAGIPARPQSGAKARGDRPRYLRHVKAYRTATGRSPKLYTLI